MIKHKITGGICFLKKKNEALSSEEKKNLLHCVMLLFVYLFHYLLIYQKNTEKSFTMLITKTQLTNCQLLAITIYLYVN